MAKILIITQARISSSRLPKKVLKILQGKSILARHLIRLKKTGLAVAVATTDEPESSLIIQEAQSLHVPATKGSLVDVLSRFHKTAMENKADVVIRVTSDCPVISADVIVAGVEMFNKSNRNNLTFCSNTLKRTYPRGFDFEIFSMELLDKAYRFATLPYDREHVTPWFYSKENQAVEIVQLEKASDDSDLRLTLDTSEDFKMFETLFEKFDVDANTDEALFKFLREHKEITDINADVRQKA